MPETKSVTTKTRVLVVLMVLFSSVGNILLRKGMTEIGEVSLASPAAMATAFLRTLASGTIWMGIGLLLAFFICYLVVLSWADFSYVMPASAVGYAVVAFLGYAVLHEVVTPLRWAGVAVICLGVLLVGRTPARTTEAN